MTEKNVIQPGTLYLVATPIGNLSDISERALKVLSEVDYVAAEDTRNSGLLLRHFGLSKPMISYFEHNKKEHGLQIIQKLKEGASVALVTDAGTPAISDPGEDLVSLCREHSVPVTSIPGCCAFVTALTLSGLSSRRFIFEGFFPTLRKERDEVLDSIRYEKRTVLFYEAPHRLKDTLQLFRDQLQPERRIAICRELTKLNEEALLMFLEDAVRYYSEKTPKGEYVLVLEGAAKDPMIRDYPESPSAHVAQYLSNGMTRMDAIKAAAKDRGLSKGQFYSLLENEKENL